MKTFLPQNKFYPAPIVTIGARSAAATPCPHPLAPAALSVSDGAIPTLYPKPQREPGESDPSVMLDYAPSETAATDSCQEPVAADSYHDEVLYLLLKLHDKPGTRDLPDIPDERAFLTEIESPFLHFLLSKKSSCDPVWADPAPLFLRGA